MRTLRASVYCVELLNANQKKPTKKRAIMPCMRHVFARPFNQHQTLPTTTNHHDLIFCGSQQGAVDRNGRRGLGFRGIYNLGSGRPRRGKPLRLVSTTKISACGDQGGGGGGPNLTQSTFTPSPFQTQPTTYLNHISRRKSNTCPNTNYLPSG